MADLLPQNFPTPSEGAVASYDWVDFASGFGYRRLYLAQAINKIVQPGGAATQVQFLTTEAMESDGEVISFTDDETAYNFDITFQNPCVIQGRVFFRTLQQSNGVLGFEVNFKLQKISGAVTTELGNVTSNNLSAAGLTYVRVCYLDAPKTSFAPNDKLRIVLQCTNAAGGACSGVVYIDPSGRATAIETNSGKTVSSESYTLIPFVVQL